jgi:hypothetical protein
MLKVKKKLEQWQLLDLITILVKLVNEIYQLLIEKVNEKSELKN